MPRFAIWVIGLSLIALSAGCPPMPPNSNGNGNGTANANANGTSNGNANGTGNGNANGTANGNTNTNTNSAPLSLSAAQQADINLSIPQIDDLAVALAGLGGLVNNQIDFSNLPAISAIDGCPDVFILGNNDAFVLSLDFGTGCAGAKTANLTFSGIIALQPFSRTTRSGSLNFENFVINGTAIDGAGTLTIAGTAATGLTFTGSVDLTIGAASVEGTITVLITQAGVITINATDLQLSDGTNAFVVDLSNVVVDPAGNNNFVPEAGTATVGTGRGALEISFTAQTPQTGVVQVSIGGSSTTYDIPGIGS